MRGLMLSGLVLAWMGATAAAFYWSNSQRLQPFAEQDGLARWLDDEITLEPLRAALAAIPHHPKATVVHFRKHDCGCTRPNDRHLERIARTYASQGVRFVLVQHGDAPGGFDLNVPWAARLPGKTLAGTAVPSAPAALVLDAGGRVAYLGPYSEGTGCFSGTGRFVEGTLDRLLRGEHIERRNLLAIGCYCPWSYTT